MTCTAASIAPPPRPALLNTYVISTGQKIGTTSAHLIINPTTLRHLTCSPSLTTLMFPPLPPFKLPLFNFLYRHLCQPHDFHATWLLGSAL
jgi:hypothetical protein